MGLNGSYEFPFSSCVASDCGVGQRPLPPGLVVTIRKKMCAGPILMPDTELALDGSALITIKS